MTVIISWTLSIFPDGGTGARRHGRAVVPAVVDRGRRAHPGAPAALHQRPFSHGNELERKKNAEPLPRTRNDTGMTRNVLCHNLKIASGNLFACRSIRGTSDGILTSRET